MLSSSSAAAGMACPPALADVVWRQVAALAAAQAGPFEGLIDDYMALLKSNRELQVRLGVYDREVAELRDEVGALTTRVAATDEAAARDFATKAESYRAELARANSELTSLLRDKSKAYEELLALQRQVDALKTAQEEAEEAAELASAEILGLKARLAEVSAALDAEKDARALAAAEAESRVAAKVAAEAEAERLRSDNRALDASLKQLMAKEVERLEQINKMHEEMMENAKRQQVEAGAASQLLGLLTRRRGSSSTASEGGPSRRSSATDAAAATPPAGQGAPPAAAGAAGGSGMSAGSAAGAAGSATGAVMWTSLKQKMGLPDAPVGAIKERQLPAQPSKFVVQAHAGGCTSLALQRPGHLAATCGLDKTVQTWDVHSGGHINTFHGIMGSVNDVAFTADGRRLLGAGGDKRLLMWNTATGQVVQTLTGHTNAVSCVSCSPLDEAQAVSAGEDRCLKVWDLSRGYSSRSLPCTKMPTALTLSADGATLITGHLDGTLSLWDLRQSRAGSQPLAEVRDHSQAILCLSPTCHLDRLLTASKDNQLRLWDFRTLATVQVLRAPHFNIGHIGSMGRGKCHAEMSLDGRWAAAGAADGQVFVWDLKAPAGSAGAVKQLRHHKEAAVAAGWASDCAHLVTADKAGGVAFWAAEE